MAVIYRQENVAKRLHMGGYLKLGSLGVNIKTLFLTHFHQLM